MPVKFGDFLLAFEFVNSGGVGTNAAFIDKESGTIYWRFGDDEFNEELPEDLDDNDIYVRVPDKRELDLGKRLALEFADQFLPNDFEQVTRIFSRRGAYGNFKDLLVRRGMLDRWHDFDNNAHERALRAWCAEHGIALAD